MSDATTHTPSRLSLFWMSTVGKKVLMALSGIILFAYVLAHLLGNLQIYLGREVINRYAELLHANEGFLWSARIILLLTIAVHITTGVQLTLLRRSARPIPYRNKETLRATAASRSMFATGLLIGGFVVYHVLDLTVGSAHRGTFIDLNPANNVVTGFSHLVPASIYIACMLGLGLHLWHGVYSMFGSLGLSHPRYTEGVKRFAALIAALIALGNISIPVAVLTGLLHY